MNSEAFKLALDTLRTAVHEYGWHRVARQYPGTNADDLTSQRRYRYGPGKFAGEHWSIVHWYDNMMSGCGGEEIYCGDTVVAEVFHPESVECEAFSIVPGNVVALFYSETGCVSQRELTQCEYKRLQEDYADSDEVQS